jgi:peptidoglycan hydrolase-like protein with peptidoglycan-binding domain
MTRPSNSFTTLSGIPVHYDRFSPPDNYGTRGKPYRFYATSSFEDKLDKCFEELWGLCPNGRAELITSGGTYVDKPSFHGQGRAFDLDGIFWSNRTFVTFKDGYQRSDRKFYFGVEAVLRKHFGTVLDYLYNADHRDHFHVDDGTGVGFRASAKSVVYFLQAALVYVFNLSVGASGIDGVYGSDTKAAVRQALSRLGITGDISNVNTWRQFLTGVAQTAFGTRSLSPMAIAESASELESEAYHPPENSLGRLADIVPALENATPLSQPFVDAKVILELEGGQIYIDAGMPVCVDGSPQAPQLDPCRGFLETSLRYPELTEQQQYVNAEAVPYFTLPEGYESLGIALGDIATIIFEGQIEFAIFANVSRSFKLSAGSLALVRSLGLHYFDGDIGLKGIPEDVIYLIFPGSGDGTPQSPEAVRQQGKTLFKKLGGQLPEDDTVTESADSSVEALSGYLQGQSPEEIDEEFSNQILQEIAQQQVGVSEASLTAESIAADVSSDVDIMARTIFGEAENQSEQGKAAVGWSIINRVKFAQAHGSYWWGNNIRQVCLKPWQYSCWNPNTPRRAVISAVTSSNPIFKRCLQIAQKVISGQISTPVDGATHYYATYMSPSPPWVHGATFVIQIGVHRFYKNVC